MKRILMLVVMVLFIGMLGCGKQELEDTKAVLAKTQAELDTVKAEKEKAKTELANTKTEADKINTELTEAKKENGNLAQLLKDPAKRIPNLTERTKTLAKELLEFYQQKDKEYSSKLSLAKREYDEARNDTEIYIDVKKCNELKQSFRELTESYKIFADSFQVFLKDKESELVSGGTEINKLKTDISKNLTNNDDRAKEMEKDMGYIQEANISIDVNKGWQSSGINAGYGDTIYIVVVGENKTFTIRSGGPKIDADGEAPSKNSSYAEKGFESVNLGALICKIGEDVKIKDKYGKKFDFISKTDGLVYLTINDTDRGNNSGKLEVKVMVVKKH